MFMHTKMLIRALSVSQHSSFVVIRRHPPFIPPSKGGQYILAFGKQTVHLLNPTTAGGGPLPYRMVGIATASSYALRQKGRQCKGWGVFTPSNRRAGACSRRCNKSPLRHGKAISSTVYTSLPYEVAKRREGSE